MDLNTALLELPKVSKEAALIIAKGIYSGHHLDLITDFIQGRITPHEVRREWHKMFYTGVLLMDAKDDSLTVINRLELMAFILNRLGFNGSEIEEHMKGEYDTAELVKALSFLTNDIVKKDGLKVRSQEERAGIVDKLNAHHENVENVVQEDIFGGGASIESPEVEVEKKEVEVVESTDTEDDLFF